MNIGIIVYSQTGNTLAVSQKLKEKLEDVGHTVDIEQVTITGDPSPGAKKFELQTIPAVEEYDALVLGAPVQAFSLASPMKAFLQQLPSLEKKKVACFVTKQLRFNWTGGNRAIRQMKKLCQAKGAMVYGTAIVVWAKSPEESTSKCVENLSSLFEQG